MKTSHEIDVTALDAAHLRALEDVIGIQLQRNQRLIISVSDVDTRCAQSLSNWTEVYEGLSDEQIESIDRDVRTRANLTRNLL
jgi:hypothetical protein